MMQASAEEEGGNEFAQTNKKIDEILDSEERFVNQITEVGSCVTRARVAFKRLTKCLGSNQVLGSIVRHIGFH